MTPNPLELSGEDQRSLAKYEDLRSTANRAVWTIHLQIQRLSQLIDDEHPEFVLKVVSDAEFLIIALQRLLLSAKAIDRLQPGLISEKITEFEAAAPSLTAARNVIAHLDEYLMGEGRNKSVHHGQLMFTSFRPDALVFAGFELDPRALVDAADRLFAVIRTCPPRFYRLAVERAARDD